MARLKCLEKGFFPICRESGISGASGTAGTGAPVPAASPEEISAWAENGASSQGGAASS